MEPEPGGTPCCDRPKTLMNTEMEIREGGGGHNIQIILKSCPPGPRVMLALVRNIPKEIEKISPFPPPAVGARSMPGVAAAEANKRSLLLYKKLLRVMCFAPEECLKEESYCWMDVGC